MQTPAAAPAAPSSSTNFAANPDLLANMSDDQIDALAGNANDAAAAIEQHPVEFRCFSQFLEFEVTKMRPAVRFDYIFNLFASTPFNSLIE